MLTADVNKVVREKVKKYIQRLIPFDSTEANDIRDAIDWVESEKSILGYRAQFYKH